MRAHGYSVGKRIYQLSQSREKIPRRIIQLVPYLFSLHSTVWTLVSGKPADSLEKSTENENECTRPLMLIYLSFTLDMIIENDPNLLKFISAPKELSSLNCGAFMAGIIASVLKCNGFVHQLYMNASILLLRKPRFQVTQSQSMAFRIGQFIY